MDATGDEKTVGKTLRKDAEQNKLTFKFHNKERRFQPFSFTYYKDFIYITGYSIDENDIKTLNLSGIDDLKM